MKVVARITSGLGNQLFQYAFGRWVAALSKRQLYLDTSWFDYFQKHTPKRTLRLRALQLPGIEEYSAGPWRVLLGVACLNQKNIRKCLQPILALGRPFFWNERKPFSWDSQQPDVPIKKDIVLNGYWQTARPAMELGEEIYKEILRHWKWSAGASQIRDEIQLGRGIFLHVRRGDYAKFGSPFLSVDYYRRAAAVLNEKISQPVKWYIFSEDAEWCREQLTFLQPQVIVDYVSANRDVEDILLMASCHGGIIANSSFSWWGAAFGHRAERPIAFPERWWGNPASEFSDLRYPDWLVIEN